MAEKASAKTVKSASPNISAAAARLSKSLGSSAFRAELAAVTKGMKAPEIMTLAKAFTSRSASSKAVALRNIEGRNNALLTSFAKSAATRGRIAGALALAVGVGSVASSLLAPSTAEAAQKKKVKQSGPSKNTVEAKKADAQAKQAEAQAEQARAETRRLELEAKAREADRADKRREADKAPLEQARQIGLVAVPLAVGMAYGTMKANKIEKAAARAAEAKNANLARVAAKLTAKTPSGVTRADRLKAVVDVADKMKLGKMKGPLGAVTAGFLVSEAVVARVVAAHQENETAREVLNAAGLGFGAAAVGTVGTRLVQRATSTIQPNAAHLVDIEGARNAAARTSAPKPPRGGKVLSVLGKAVLPVTAAAAATLAYSQAAHAAEARGADATTVRAEGATEAVRATTSLLTMGGADEVEQSRKEGRGIGESLGRGAVVAAVNYATMGVVPLLNDQLERVGGAANLITNMVQGAAGTLGEVARELGGGTAHASSDAVEGGTRTEDSAAAKIGGIVIGGLGGAMALEGRATLKAPPTHVINGVPHTFDGKPVTPASKVARVAKGSGLLGAGLTLATLGFSIATHGQGKAYLNDAAARKAQAPPKPVAPIGVVAAQPQRTDGQTDAYTRRTKTGQAVQVKAYRTPNR